MDFPPNRQLTTGRVEPYICFGCRRYMCDLEGPHMGTTLEPTTFTDGAQSHPFCSVCSALLRTLNNSTYFVRLDKELKELRGKVGL